MKPVLINQEQTGIFAQVSLEAHFSCTYCDQVIDLVINEVLNIPDANLFVSAKQLKNI